MPENKVPPLDEIIKEYNLTRYFDIVDLGDKVLFISKKFQSDLSALEEIRKEMGKLGITEQDIEDAVKWAREQIKAPRNEKNNF